MKNKYFVMCEDGFDTTTGTEKFKVVKTFKNQSDALSFINNPRSQHQYRGLTAEMVDANGVRFEYTERTGEWNEKN